MLNLGIDVIINTENIIHIHKHTHMHIHIILLTIKGQGGGNERPEKNT